MNNIKYKCTHFSMLQYPDVKSSTSTKKPFRNSIKLANYRDGASRGLGFEIGEELIEHGVPLGINADEYR
jgi:hypothetical protein